MPTQTANKATVPAGSDGWNLVPDIKKAIETTGSIIKVASPAERDGLAALFPGGALPVPTHICRTDIVGAPIMTWNGTKWVGPGFGHLSTATNAGATATGTAENSLVTTTVNLEPNRRILITAKVLARPDIAGLFASYKIKVAGTVELEPYVKRFAEVELSESFEFSAEHGSGAGGSTTFHLGCVVVHPAVTTGLVKSGAFSIKLRTRDIGST